MHLARIPSMMTVRRTSPKAVPRQKAEGRWLDRLTPSFIPSSNPAAPPPPAGSPRRYPTPSSPPASPAAPRSPIPFADGHTEHRSTQAPPQLPAIVVPSLWRLGPIGGRKPPPPLPTPPPPRGSAPEFPPSRDHPPTHQRGPSRRRWRLRFPPVSAPLCAGPKGPRGRHADPAGEHRGVPPLRVRGPGAPRGQPPRPRRAERDDPLRPLVRRHPIPDRRNG